MELREWIMGNVELFGVVHMWGSKDKNYGGTPYEIRGEGDYDEFIGKYGKGCAYSSSGFREYGNYYFLWDGLGCYTIKLDEEDNDFFGGDVWGNVGWRGLLVGKYGDLGAVIDKGFNDMIVTGWCRLGFGVNICVGFVGKI